MSKIIKSIYWFLDQFFNIPFIKNWLDKHPRIKDKLISRLSPDRFNGLPLTLLIVILFIILILLLGVIQDYLFNNPLILADVRIENLLYVFRSSSLLNFSYFITLFAEPITIIILLIVLSILLWIYRQRLYLLTLWLAVIMGSSITTLGKYIFHRERPDVILRTINENSFSFPSGHATTVVVFYGFITYFIIKNTKSAIVKIMAVITFIAGVILVDLSRLYLGVHYLSDVWAGNLVGFAALIIVIISTEWFRTNKNNLIVNKLKFSEIFLAIFFIWTTVFVMYSHAKLPENKIRDISFQKIDTVSVLSIFDNGVSPRFTETIDGSRQEPINLIVLASSSCFTSDIEKANWTLADSVTLDSMGKVAEAAWLNRPYPTAPMTPSFYNAYPNDYGFEKQTNQDTARSRHHVRFWKTNYTTSLGDLYVGTVSLDTGLKWGITHKIAPDIDTERDLFVSDLREAGVIDQERLISFVSPVLGTNFTGDQFFTNGKAALIFMRGCVNP